MKILELGLGLARYGNVLMYYMNFSISFLGETVCSYFASILMFCTLGINQTHRNEMKDGDGAQLRVMMMEK